MLNDRTAIDVVRIAQFKWVHADWAIHFFFRISHVLGVQVPISILLKSGVKKLKSKKSVEPPHTTQTMAYSMIISSALPTTDEPLVRTTFEQLGLGVLDKIDIVPSSSRGVDCLKVFLHYTSASAAGERLRAKLEDNQERQKQGEMIPPVKIVYGTTRDGRDRYWQLYAAPTPAQRIAQRTAKTEGFKARIEM